MPPRNKAKRPLLPAAEKTISKKGTEPVGHSSRTRRRLEALAHVFQATPVLPQDSTQSAATPETRGKSNFTLGIDIRGRLAMLGHAMLLLAHLQRAQQGALLPRNPLSISHPSIRVNRRWLEAVTAYSGTTVTVDDVARVATVFPNWVRATWGVGETPWGERGVGNGRGLRPLSDGAELPPQASTVGGTRIEGVKGAALATEELTVRLHILTSHVPSTEEAGEELQRLLQEKHGSKSEAWLDGIVQRRALDAYREQQTVESPGGPILSTQEPLSRAPRELLEGKGKLASPIAAPDRGVEGPQAPPSPSADVRSQSLASSPGEPPHDDEGEDNAALLAMLSPQLKVSLSAAKLKQVLRFMKKEASNTAAEELARIERKQEEERLLNTYAHVRSLFGLEKTEMNAARLLEHLAVESLFEDHRRILPQLSLLLNRSGFGLSAMTLSQDEDGVVNSPTTEGPVAPLKKVNDLSTLTAEELENTLVLLDRTKASLKTL
ncbi:unnamed protein product [Phytomonas sp. EM1]|nr:unnamed protein product [Phytomonas sp. EM1]|eukprot:CCW63293.1 unnamed protein product [Phytomonas sp. isolate EM1]